MTPRWLHWPAAGADDWDNQDDSEFLTMLLDDGAQTYEYLISNVADESVSTVNSTWTEFRGDQNQGSTISTNNHGSITLPGSGNGFCVQSGNLQIPTTSKDYLAVYFSSGMATGAFGRADNAGWIVYNRESTNGSVDANRQTFVPIEAYVFNDVSAGDPGGAVISDTAFTTKTKFVFFNGYTTGSAASWTTPTL